MLIRPSRPNRGALIVAVVLTGCRSSAPAPETKAPPQPDGPHGLDTTAIDRTVDPGDDFYGFANGAWMKRTEIPADRSTWGPTEAMTEEAASRTRELLESAAKASPAAGTVQQQAADYYASYIDEAGIE